MPTGPILIVDDEAPNLAALEAILSPTYRLLVARDGPQALSVATRHKPVLVLLDVQMPGMDGLEVCRKMGSDPLTEGIPVIFVTSLADSGDEAAGLDAGAVDYIVKPVSPPIVLARVHTHLQLVRASRLAQSHRDAIHMLGEAGHFNDTDTGVHIWRMAAVAAALARNAGWDVEQCALIDLAAAMHDTGKIGIRHAILKKPGPLDADEWLEMKTHSQIGHDILVRSDAPVFQLAAEIALRHHERWDGTGYPGGLQGEAIPESARIVALADVFDALTMRRPYKEPWPLDRVLETMRASSGSHFDPRLMEVFEATLPETLRVKAAWDCKEIAG